MGMNEVGEGGLFPSRLFFFPMAEPVEQRVQSEEEIAPQTIDQEIGPSQLTPLEEKLLAMGHDQLLELARAFNVGR